MKISSTLNIEKIKDVIGAVIHDIDLNHVDEKQLANIRAALLQHKVIFFRKQFIQPHVQAALAGYFGKLHIHPIYAGVKTTPEIMILDSYAVDLRDNELWHTDVTFSAAPPLGCVLQAIKIPEVGGDTLWSNSEIAFSSLAPELQQRLLTLTATHDIRKSFPLERFAKDEQQRQKLEQAFAKNPPTIHPVVVTHPETQAKILFINEGFTTKINELDDLESQQLLDDLFNHATQACFSLRWQWQEGDIAIWDNRCTQHKALFDYGDAHRIMHRATVLGTQPRQ